MAVYDAYSRLVEPDLDFRTALLRKKLLSQRERGAVAFTLVVFRERDTAANVDRIEPVEVSRFWDERRRTQRRSVRLMS